MIIQEGRARIFVENINEKGPGRIQGVFYNREMVFNRDSTIFLLKNLGVRNALDATAATGVRGIRMILEASVNTVINDSDSHAYEIILKNVELNGIRARVENRDANSLMAENRYDYVDIDPFGSPVPFIDIALRSGRILGISATDTATLSGRNARIKRRYLADIQGLRGNHEIGVRVLLGYIGRMAARFDLGIAPIFSFWRKHAYRVYVRVKRGVGNAKKTMNNIRNTPLGGPLWVGDLHDFEFLKNAKVPDIPTRKEFEKMLSLWKNEKFFLYYSIPEICSELHKSQPQIKEIIEKLREIGYEAYRTHFSPQGVRTNAPRDEIARVITSLAEKSK